ALGHALRREWWPLGLVCLAAGGRSRAARAGATAMLAPIALEWIRHRPALDPVRYTALRLTEDLAYGSGVTRSAWTHRSLAPLLPRVRLPLPSRSSPTGIRMPVPAPWRRTGPAGTDGRMVRRRGRRA
ncbi:hypothetical protein ACFFNX_32610, partial [Actinoallomurus acaciae]